MLSYRAVHNTNEGYGLAVMWVLIVMFLLAVPFMFIHPAITLLLFFVGLIILAVASGIEKLFRCLERVAARSELSNQQCPSCGASIDGDSMDTAEMHCEHCGSTFSLTGVQLS